MPRSGLRCSTPGRRLATRVTILVLIAVVLALSNWGRKQEESLALHSLFQLRGPLPAPPDLVVLSITEQTASARQLSADMTAWSRGLYADTLVALGRAPAAIAFDIFFETASADDEGDRRFARALEEAGNVTLFAYFERSFHPLDAGSLQADRVVAPASLFTNSAAAIAPFALPKIPASVTRYPLYLGSPPVPVLPLTVLRQTRPAAQPTIDRQRPLFNFYGPAGTITTIPLESFLAAPGAFASTMDGATIFVGFAASFQPGQRDNFVTAFSDDSGLDLSGVELAATAYANLRDDQQIRECAPLVSAAIIALLGLILGLIVGRLARRAGIACLLLGTVYAGIAYVCFVHYGRLLPIAVPLLYLFPALALVGYHHHLNESRRLRVALEQAFSQYLPPAEIRRLSERASGSLRQQELYGVCLVTDATAFTTLAERLPAQELSTLMSGYYEALITPIRRHGGLISDVAGDGVIALWTDITRADVMQRLMPALNDLRASISDFNRQHADTPLLTRMGLHAGNVMLGHYGAEGHFEFRAVGDLVNTACRIEALNKLLGTDILISDSCTAPDAAGLRYLGQFRLSGKQQAVCLYALPGRHSVDPNLFHIVERDLKHDDPAAALQQLARTLQECPDDGPALFYRQYLQIAAQTNTSEAIWPITITSK